MKRKAPMRQRASVNRPHTDSASLGASAGPALSATMKSALGITPPPMPIPIRALSENPLVRVGSLLLMFYVFLLVSRVLDVSFYWLRIPMITYVLLVSSAILCGSLQRAFRSRLGLVVLALSVWIVFTAVFSIWRGGSLILVRNTVQGLLLFVAVAGLTRSLVQARRLMYTIALAAAVTAALSFLMGRSVIGRLAVQSGSLADPNEFAMTLLVGAPFWFLDYARAGAWIRKAAAIAFVTLMAAAFLLTGSRGGLIALLLVLGVLFLRASLKAKALLAAAAPLAMLAAWLLLPPTIRMRYFTFFEEIQVTGEIDPVTRQQLVGSAVASAESRLDLLFRSLRMTLEHPLLGVGPGMFPVAVYEEARSRGEHTPWLVTHNTYTQMSSETGVLGFLLYTVAIGMCLGRAHALARRARTPTSPSAALAQLALVTWLAFLALAVCALFLSVAYTLLFYVLAGLVVSLESIAAASGVVPVQARQFAPAPVPAAPDRR